MIMKHYSFFTIISTLVLLAGCGLIVDSTPPEVSLTSRVSGNTAEIDVVAKDDESGIKSINLYMGDTHVHGLTIDQKDIVRGSKDFRATVSGLTVGGHTFTAVAVNGFGREGQKKLEVTVQSAGGSNDGAPIVAPGSVFIDTAAIEPGFLSPKPSDCQATDGRCYGGTISIPVAVDDPAGGASVRLIVSTPRLGTAPLEDTLTTFPYVFSLNTGDYRNNEVLTIKAEATSASGGVKFSDEIKLTVFNPAPPPILAITSPATDTTVTGQLSVGLSINQLTDSGYTLENGFLIQMFDFGNRKVFEQSYTKDVQPNISGAYLASNLLDTTKLANDRYELRVTANVRYVETRLVVPLVKSVYITNANESQVPPSLLILSPTDQREQMISTIHDTRNAYISLQVTDNTGVRFVDVRIFKGDPTEDATPSRFVRAFNPPVTYATASVPLNFNANPYLTNGNYTVRVVAEDVDGNRTFQDLKIILERKESPYRLLRTGPFDAKGNLASPVKPGSTVSFEIDGSPLDDATFDYLMRGPGESHFSPLFDGTGRPNKTFSIGLAEEGSYDFVAQIMDKDGGIYLTNYSSVVVKEVEEEEEVQF